MHIYRKAAAAGVAGIMAGAALMAGAGGAQAAVGAPQISYGDQGFGVYCVQEGVDYFLDDNNYYAAPDGDFGPQTLRVVERFQEQSGLQQDGQVGPLTGTAVWHSVQDLINHIEEGGGSIGTPWGVPLTNCYQVLPTTS